MADRGLDVRILTPLFILAVVSLLVGCQKWQTTHSAADSAPPDDCSVLPFASAPIGGEVVWTHYEPGRFLNVLNP